MRPALIIVAAVLEVLSWRVVARRGRATEWNLMLAVFAAQGVIALAMWHTRWSTDVAPGVAVFLGLATGALLYGATRAFVAVAVRVPSFRSQVADRYRTSRDIPLPAGLALAMLIAAPAEEVFWRGFVQGLSGNHTSEVMGLAIALVGYVVVKSASGSLPLVAAALVGGAVWGGLTVFTGGVLAALLCHGLWTGLMLALPPGAGRYVPPREMMPA